MGALVLVVHAFALPGMGSRPSRPSAALRADVLADDVPVGYWGPDGTLDGAVDGFAAAVLAPDGWAVADELGVGLPLVELAVAGPHPATDAATATSHAP
jgi:hypothetical protein